MFKITSPDQHGAGSYMANQHDAYGVLMDMLVSSTTKGEKIWHLEQKIDGVWVLVVVVERDEDGKFYIDKV